MRNVTVLILVLASGLALAACGGKATITGIVEDTQGNPIADAAATVEGSTAMGTSDATGHFSVAWLPGTLRVVVGKPGYLSYSADVEALEAKEYDLGTIQLQRTPPEKGLWLFDGGEFTPVARVGIERQAKGLERNYCLTAPGEPTRVPAGDVVFFDWSQLDRHLIRLSENGCAGVSAGPPKYETIVDDDLGETVDELADDMKLRKVRLDPGRYVYADWTNGWFRSEGSFFQVQ